MAGVDDAAVAALAAFAHMVDGDWSYVELPTWHWPMVSRPAELAEVLELVIR